jgi:hypothetical protein
MSLSFNLRDELARDGDEPTPQARALGRSRTDEQIIADARALIGTASSGQFPSFVRERFERLHSMLEMAGDPQWSLSSEDRQRLLNAFSCFERPASEDARVDYLDQSIMIELVSRDLEHDIAAYREFCELRASHMKRLRPGADHQARHDEWLEQTREALQHRMHSRRTQSLDRTRSSVRRLFSLFGL